MVGGEVIQLLEERSFPVHELVPLASEQSAGERMEVLGRNYTVKKLTGNSFEGVDLAFFSSGASQSLAFARVAVSAGAVVIDISNAFRMDPAIPLIVPEVNAHAITKHAGIISIPSSSTIGMVLVLKPIHDAAKIRRVVVTTLQSVSGGGKRAIDELAQQTVSLLNFRDIKKSEYPHQIAFNCIPHAGDFVDGEVSKEEMGMSNETGRIMEDGTIRVTATSVQVPVFRCYSESVNIEMEKKMPADEIRAILSAAPGIIVYDDPARNLYPMAIDVAGKDEIYVGRIREDASIPNGVNLWLVMDNIRKGAALNAVQIAEHLINRIDVGG